MVDETRLLRLLRAISDDVAVLAREADADEQRRNDPLWLRGVKYTFVTAIEACIDAAQHICASEGWGPPENNANAMTVLARHGVVPHELAVSLRLAVGFRNVLVHEYVAVDDELVLRRLRELTDLTDFVLCVTEWLHPG